MGMSGSTCTLITASTALNTLTAVRLTVRRPEETLATWHALHQGKAQQTILERRIQHDQVVCCCLAE